MSHSSANPFSDDDDDTADQTKTRSTRARLSSPGAAAAAPPYVVPRIIRTAAASSRYRRSSTWGYSPKVSVDMAVAHSWAPYAAVVRALRSLSLLSLKDDDREAARAAVAELCGHAAPFSGVRRFPAGEVFVCLDRPPFARKMQGIQQPLIKAEAAGSYGEEFVSACSIYMSGIGDALDELTRVRRDDDRSAPVLYDRAVFESAFLLRWTEP
ncbi:uncharacterized protein [Lolium perenne]|uniref:uncharacterized protein n=1 Tax=Lolium perenne TaxID=4522 RepID=UPI0021EAC959|nr:uncharacterized protein LOC127329875 [Lolium perenne]